MSSRFKWRAFHSLKVLIPLMFIVLALTFQGLMGLYWIGAVAPAIRSESETAAKAMAYFKSDDIANALSASGGRIDPGDLAHLMDLSLLVTNPVTETPFIQGIALELDPAAVSTIDGQTSVKRGNPDCSDCYVTEIPLFDRHNRELLAIATFYMSMDFFQALRKDMILRFLLLSFLTLGLTFTAWLFALRMVRPLGIMADFLQSRDGRDLGAIPELTGPVPFEIGMVKRAMDGLLSKAQAHAARLDQANRELKNAQAQLVQAGRLASIGELAAGVAHELNQPLMVIRGTAQILAGNPSALPPDLLTEQLRTVERNTLRMMNIIDHLRIFSRQSAATFTEVDVNGVIEDAFLMVGEQLRLRSIQVERNLSRDLQKCHGNPGQLEQVFLNLITNARDAIVQKSENTETGTPFTGRLTVATRNGEDGADGIEILFLDNGCGISEDHLGKMFDPFFTTKAVGKGTGLGLSISYGIIKDHKGRISVEETSPDGTRLAVFLPTTGCSA